MKRKSLLVCLLAVFCLFMLAACGPDARITSAGKLVSSYFKIDTQSKETVTILKVKTYQDGYLAAALYSGSGDHLVLFKIVKDAKGTESISQMCEGEAAGAAGYSINMSADGNGTIFFGNITDTAAAYNKMDITYDNGTKVSEPVSGDKGFIIVADGSPKIKDFTFSGAKGSKSGFQDYLKAGGAITKTGFADVKGN